MKLFKNFNVKFWGLGTCCVLIVLISGVRLFKNYELLTYDLRFHLRPEQKVSPDIAIINIDDQTLGTLGQWPLPRDFHASLVDALQFLGAKAIVFDILFSEPSEFDAPFAKSLQIASNVYLPLALDLGRSTDSLDLISQDHPSLAGITPSLKAASGGVGHINVIIDPDGKTRRVPLWIKSNHQLIPQVSLKAAYDFLGKKFTVLKIPDWPQNELIVNYPGTWTKSFQQFSYLGILKAYHDVKTGQTPSLDINQLKGKVCFVGLTATGTTDFNPTPLESVYPMLGLQASVFNSIITKQFIRDPGILINTVINLMVFVLSLFVFLKLSPIQSFGSSLGLLVIYFSTSVLLFNFWGLWIDVFLPVLLIVLTYAGVTLFKFFNEIKKRELLEKELEIAQTIQKQFLPGQIQKIPGYFIEAFMQPAKYVGGDLYDIVPVADKRVGFLIGDVAGKGISAALLMAQTISLFRLLARQGMDAAKVLVDLNKELCGRSAGRFVTALYFIADQESKQISVASAGQGPLLIYRKNEHQVVDIPLAGNVPLGLMEDVTYAAVEVPVNVGDRVMVFSDGLLEGRSQKGEEFGLERIKKVILQNAGNSNQKTLESMKAELFQFTAGAVQHDDITILIFSLE